ncbi:hypothetical protein EDB83DRAFT_2318893 [Lactarius deliciosus]|nr:hypothetical protein EDB83DRAFT_2318893 [Lactarius deliciosus]
MAKGVCGDHGFACSETEVRIKIRARETISHESLVLREIRPHTASKPSNPPDIEETAGRMLYSERVYQLYMEREHREPGSVVGALWGVMGLARHDGVAVAASFRASEREEPRYYIGEGHSGKHNGTKKKKKTYLDHWASAQFVINCLFLGCCKNGGGRWRAGTQRIITKPQVTLSDTKQLVTISIKFKAFQSPILTLKPSLKHAAEIHKSAKTVRNCPEISSSERSVDRQLEH